MYEAAYTTRPLLGKNKEITDWNSYRTFVWVFTCSPGKYTAEVSDLDIVSLSAAQHSEMISSNNL